MTSVLSVFLEMRRVTSPIRMVAACHKPATPMAGTLLMVPGYQFRKADGRRQLVTLGARPSPLLLAVSEPQSLTPPDVRLALSRLRRALKPAASTSSNNNGRVGVRGDELRPWLRILASYDRWQLPVREGDAILSYQHGDTGDAILAMASDNAGMMAIRQQSAGTKIVTGWHMFQRATLVPSVKVPSSVAGLAFNALSDTSSSYLYIPSSLFGLLNNVAASSALDSFLYNDAALSSTSGHDNKEPNDTLIVPPAARDIVIAVLGSDGGVVVPRGPAKESVFQCCMHSVSCKH
jgi:hypothetical protein